MTVKFTARWGNYAVGNVAAFDPKTEASLIANSVATAINVAEGAIFEGPENQILITDSSDTRVTGSLFNLAISTPATIVFDLGSSWDEFSGFALSLINGVTSATPNMIAYASDDGVTNLDRLGTSAGPLAFTGDAATMQVQGIKPAGRYVRVVFTNGAGSAQGATTKMKLVTSKI